MNMKTRGGNGGYIAFSVIVVAIALIIVAVFVFAPKLSPKAESCKAESCKVEYDTAEYDRISSIFAELVDKNKGMFSEELIKRNIEIATVQMGNRIAYDLLKDQFAPGDRQMAEKYSKYAVLDDPRMSKHISTLVEKNGGIFG